MGVAHNEGARVTRVVVTCSLWFRVPRWPFWSWFVEPQPNILGPSEFQGFDAKAFSIFEDGPGGQCDAESRRCAVAQ